MKKLVQITGITLMLALAAACGGSKNDSTGSGDTKGKHDKNDTWKPYKPDQASFKALMTATAWCAQIGNETERYRFANDSTGEWSQGNQQATFQWGMQETDLYIIQTSQGGDGQWHQIVYEVFLNSNNNPKIKANGHEYTPCQ